MIPAAVYGLVMTFNLFSLIYFLSGGGPLRQTEILVTTAYRLINEQRLYGVAAAFCVYIFLILLTLTLITNADFTRNGELRCIITKSPLYLFVSVKSLLRVA